MRAIDSRAVASVEQLPDPSAAVRTFLAAWLAARKGGLVPKKQDFDPLAVFPLLPDLWIYQYHREEDAFRCRLAGERINAAWGYSIAGRTSLEIFGARDNEIVSAIWKKILDVPLIHYGKLERLTGTVVYAAERAVVPLSDESGQRIYVLGLSLYSLGGPDHLTPPAIPENAFHIDCRHL